MKVLLAIVILILIAVSLLADYKWKRWMAARKHDREQPPPNTQ